jgi:hypothetical protein
MRQGLYDNLSNKCKSVIKTNNPEESIKKISNLKLPGSSNKLGKDAAFKIYNLYSDESVEYKQITYQNDINKYKNKVNNNIKKAEKYSKQ